MAKERNETAKSQKLRMVEGSREANIENTNDIFNLWAEGFSKISKIWQESFSNLFKPWMDSDGDFFERMINPALPTDPKKSMEFYQTWVKIYEDTWGAFFPQLSKNVGKEDVQRMVDGAQELNKLVESWSTELKSDMDKTKKMMEDELSQENLMEVYKMWCKSYERIFNDIVYLPASENLQTVFGESAMIPSPYSKTMMEFAKLWKASYEELYSPLADEMLDLHLQSLGLLGKDVSSEAYNEFYQKWMSAYHKAFQRMFRSPMPSTEMMENLMESTNLFSEMYKSWQGALEQMSSRIGGLLKQPMSPETYQSFYETWTKAYDKAFADLFEHMPTIGPMKEMMEPMKDAFKTYMDTLTKMSQSWMKMSKTEGRKEG